MGVVVQRRFAQVCGSGGALEDRRKPLASADTHRLQGVAPLSAVEFTQHGGQDAHARGAHRMPSADEPSAGLQFTVTLRLAVTPRRVIATRAAPAEAPAVIVPLRLPTALFTVAAPVADQST